jgi:DmsE family decaheme c-type cytochrome
MNIRTALLALALVLPALPAAAQDAPAAEPAKAEAPAYSRKGADTCLNCHGDDAEVMAIFRTKHAQPKNPNTPFGHGQLQCEACHGPGGAHTGRVKRGEQRPPVVRFGRDTETPVEQQNGMCLTCHNPKAGEWHASAHRDRDVGCADCHDSHAPRDPVLTKASQADVCGTCHQVQKQNALLPFAHPLRDQQMACTGCHSPHGSTSEAALKRDTVNETCYACHADKRGPFLWEHQPVSEDCGLCHQPHGSSHPAMLKQRAPFLCQQCHQSQGHPSVPGLPSALPGGTPSATVLASGCSNCHSQVHGSNHPSGRQLMR